MSVDGLLWLPWVLAACVVTGWLGWRAGRRGDRAGALWWAGWTLLPPALLLTGTVRLVGRIASAVTGWASGLVFSPVTWIGVAVGAAGVALIGTGAALRRRRAGGAVDPPAGRRQVPARRPPPVDDDLAEIEEILRRRGIR